MADSLYTTIHKPSDDNTDVATNIHLNLLINATQNATLKVIMDQQSGDYIALNGDGVIRATYYNKGAFDMFGNYNVDHGVYKLTIQNVIKWRVPVRPEHRTFVYKQQHTRQLSDEHQRHPCPATC